MPRETQSRMNGPFYIGLRGTVLARINSVKLTEDTDLSEALDSLDRVQLEMELQEFGIETTVPIKSVGDLLWLFKAVDLRRGARRQKSTANIIAMTLDEAREEVISGIDYAAYKETDSSLHDATRNACSVHNTTSRVDPFTNLVRGQRGILTIRWQLFCGWLMH